MLIRSRPAASINGRRGLLVRLEYLFLPRLCKLSREMYMVVTYPISRSLMLTAVASLRSVVTKDRVHFSCDIPPVYKKGRTQRSKIT